MQISKCLLILPALLFSAIAADPEFDTEGSTEQQEIRAIEALMAKTREGGDSPSAQDLKLRHETGVEMAKKARDFLERFPESGKVDDANALLNLGLMQAAIAGSAQDMANLDQRRQQVLTNAQLSDNLKIHTIATHHKAQWARKNGQRNAEQDREEDRKVFMEGLFAAADALPNKDTAFELLLLQAKSGIRTKYAENRALAERVRNHPGASDRIKAEADRILSGERPFAIGEPVDIRFTALDGRKVDIKDLAGKVVFVDFWATWCGPCVAAFPALKATYDNYHGRGLEVIGISLDEDKGALQRFVKKHGVAWPQYYDGKGWNNEISFRFGINAVPTLWIIDKKGNLRYTKHSQDEQGLEAAFLSLNREDEAK